MEKFSVKNDQIHAKIEKINGYKTGNDLRFLLKNGCKSPKIDLYVHCMQIL